MIPHAGAQPRSINASFDGQCLGNQPLNVLHLPALSTTSEQASDQHPAVVAGKVDEVAMPTAHLCVGSVAPTLQDLALARQPMKVFICSPSDRPRLKTLRILQRERGHDARNGIKIFRKKNRVTMVLRIENLIG